MVIFPRSWEVAADEPAQQLVRTWRERWPASSPQASWLKTTEAERWVRFHSLPAAKRYATTAAEREEILIRHRTVLADLIGDTASEHGQPGPRLLVLTCHDDSPSPTPVQQEAAKRLVGGQHWLSVDEDIFETDTARGTDRSDEEAPTAGLGDPEEDQAVWHHCFIARLDADDPALDALLQAVAEEEVWGVLVMPTDLRWLYHPYDGGADVIVATTEQRDALGARHAGWLPPGPGRL